MIISNRLSTKITSDLLKNGVIKKSYKESYNYCLEFFFDLILFNCSLLLIGFILHRFILSVIFVLVMVPVKMTAGGAHAPSRLMCEIISLPL